MEQFQTIFGKHLDSQEGSRVGQEEILTRSSSVNTLPWIYDFTQKIFTNPKEKLTEDYISGRFG